MPRYGASPLLLLSLSLPALAGDVFPSNDEGDIPAVLSATRLRQSLLDAPAATTIIDRQMIELSGVREIPELLRLVPGMVVGYESGSEAFVSHHGTSADLARRMQVLVDGRSIYQPLLASVDWVGLPLELEDIERVEIIRGPDSAAYGVNSFLGVVNIITRHPADTPGGTISYRQGQDGISDYVQRFGGRVGDVDWRVTAARRDDDGFLFNRRRGGIDFTDSKRVESVYGRAFWSIDPGQSLDISFGLARMDAQLQYRSPIYIAPPVAERENGYLSLAWDNELNEHHTLKLQASYSRFTRHEPWLISLPPVVFLPSVGALYDQNRACSASVLKGKNKGCLPADLPLIAAVQADVGADPGLMKEIPFRSVHDVHEERAEVEIHDTVIFSPDLRAVMGLTYDHANVDSLTFVNGAIRNDVLGGFAHAEWRFAPDWLLNIGGSLEDDQIAGRYFSPRYALNWRFADNQAARLVYSRAIRSPDMLENRAYWQYRAETMDPSLSAYNGTYFQRGIAKGDAPAEKIESREIGYYGRFDKAHLNVDIRAFNDIMWLAEHDIEIETFNTAPNKRYGMQGNEVSLDWRPVPGHRLQLNYAYLEMSAQLGEDNGNFVPRHSGSLGWWQDHARDWKAGVTYYFYNDLRDRMLYWDRLDMQIIRQFHLPDGHLLDLTATLQKRLTDDSELRSENGADMHRAWLGVSYHFL